MSSVISLGGVANDTQNWSMSAAVSRAAALRLGMFSSRLMVACEHSSPPLSGQRPTASFSSGSYLSRSRSLPSS
jgi:hypothetical protein